MKRRIALLLAATLTIGVVTAATPALADDDDDIEGGTYLALGDSVAAGTQQPLPFTKGYVDRLFRELEDEYDFDRVVNLACPGDDTREMISGIGGASEDGSLCYGPNAVLPPGGTSQLDAAVAYIEDNPGEVRLITLTIGANDILACDPDAADLEVCLAQQLGEIATNLPFIVARLMVAAPGVPIIATNYYNPNLAFWIIDPAIAEASLALTPLFNGTLQAVYDAFGVPVADVASAFKTFQTQGKKVPKNVRAICKFTLMCERQGGELVLSDYDPVTPGPQTDIHPSNRGYRKIANTLEDLIDDLELFDDD